MATVLDQLIESIKNLDARLKELSKRPTARGCYDILDPGEVIDIAGFIRAPDGIVSLDGNLEPFPFTPGGGLVTTLPPGYRPCTDQYYPLPYGGVAKVAANGDVTIEEPPGIIIDIVKQEWDTTAGTDTLTMTVNPAEPIFYVSRNGVIQSELNGDYFKLDADIIFSTPFVDGEHVVAAWSPLVDAPGTSRHEEFSPTPGADSVTFSHLSIRVSNVSRNGIEQASPSGYAVFGNSIVFTDPFVAAERVVVGYTALPGNYGRPMHDEFIATAGQTDFLLSGIIGNILLVSRNGIVQSLNAGDFSVHNSTIRLSTPCVLGELVTVAWVYTEVVISLNSISFKACQ